MSIPRLTIPETAFDPSLYTVNKRRSQLLGFLFKLTNRSALFLIVVYAVSFLGLKPLLELTASRRYELLEKYRHKLRDLYLLLISKVDNIPIIKINKNGKVVTDAMTQTDTHQQDHDKVGQGVLLEKLKKLNGRLDTLTCYSVQEMPHYRIVRDDVKAFQHQVDTKMFNYDELYTVETPERKRNLVVDTKNDIRSIKGLYMSGKA